MHYYISTTEEDLTALNEKRIFISDFDPEVGDYITVAGESFLILAREHIVDSEGAYKGTRVHVKEKQPTNWKGQLTRG